MQLLVTQPEVQHGARRVGIGIERFLERLARLLELLRLELTAPDLEEGVGFLLALRLRARRADERDHDERDHDARDGSAHQNRPVATTPA
jgi:hypothetical protein